MHPADFRLIDRVIAQKLLLQLGLHIGDFLGVHSDEPFSWFSTRKRY